MRKLTAGCSMNLNSNNSQNVMFCVLFSHKKVSFQNINQSYGHVLFESLLPDHVAGELMEMLLRDVMVEHLEKHSVILDTHNINGSREGRMLSCFKYVCADICSESAVTECAVDLKMICPMRYEREHRWLHEDTQTPWCRGSKFDKQITELEKSAVSCILETEMNLMGKEASHCDEWQWISITYSRTSLYS